MLRNLLNNKFNSPTTLNLEWLDYFRNVFLTLVFSSAYHLNAQNSCKLYFGTNMNKLWLISDNLDIAGKSATKPTVSPLLGFEFNTKKITLGLELSFFKTNYSNEFKYKDKFQNNVVITAWKGKFITTSLIAKTKILDRGKSNICLITKFNILNSSAPYDEKTYIFGPNTYTLISNQKSNLGYFYSISTGFEYQLKLNKKWGVFSSAQLNSNFNRTLVEENNTISYPDETMAFQFLKINGKSVNINIGLTYKFQKGKKSSTPSL